MPQSSQQLAFATGGILMAAIVNDTAHDEPSIRGVKFSEANVGLGTNMKMGCPLGIKMARI